MMIFYAIFQCHLLYLHLKLSIDLVHPVNLFSFSALSALHLPDNIIFLLTFIHVKDNLFMQTIALQLGLSYVVLIIAFIVFE